MPKVQYNTSTGKVIYDATAEKAQMAGEAPEYEYSEYDCECFDAGKAPLYYTLVFSGVLLCPERSWPGGVDLNAIWQLTKTEDSACDWEYIDDDWTIWMNVTYGIGSEYRIDAHGTSEGLYFIRIGSPKCTISGTDNNNYTDSCIFSRAYDGSVQWCPGWHPGGCS